MSYKMIEALIAIATFDVMPSDEVMAAIPGIPEEDDDEQADENFTEIGFESNYMIINLGTMFLVFIFILCLPVMLIFTKPCDRWKSVHKKRNGCKKSLQGNVFIRYFLESCLDISICASLNYIYSSAAEDSIRWDTMFQVLNNVTLIVLVVTIAVLPPWIIYFYCKYFKKW